MALSIATQLIVPPTMDTPNTKVNYDRSQDPFVIATRAVTSAVPHVVRSLNSSTLSRIVDAQKKVDAAKQVLDAAVQERSFIVREILGL